MFIFVNFRDSFFEDFRGFSLVVISVTSTCPLYKMSFVVVLCSLAASAVSKIFKIKPKWFWPNFTFLENVKFGQKLK